MSALPVPAACPFCSGPLSPRVLACASCAVRIEGEFAAGWSPFAALSPEEQAFAALFLLSSGSLKRVGQRLGISYPTVKARLGEVQATLRRAAGEPGEGAPGAVIPPEGSADEGIRHPHPSRDEERTGRILAALERGEVDVETALQRLGRLSGEQRGEKGGPP